MTPSANCLHCREDIVRTSCPSLLLTHLLKTKALELRIASRAYGEHFGQHVESAVDQAPEVLMAN